MKRIPVYVAAVMMTACVPMRMTYFRPNGDGQVLASPCGGSPDRLRIELPQSVLADVAVMRMSRESLSVAVSYYVPSNASVRLVSGVVRVVDVASGSQQDVTPPTVRQQCGTGPKDYGCELTVPPTTRMEGATVKDGSLLGLSKADRGLFFLVEVPFSAKALTVTPPDIEINGVVVQMKAIAFDERTTTEWTGLCQ